MMKSDVQIAQEAVMKPIKEVAAKVGLDENDLELYGNYKAKIHLDVLDRYKDKADGKLILVTAINPTAAGEPGTTTRCWNDHHTGLRRVVPSHCVHRPCAGCHAVRQMDSGNDA